MKFTDEKSQKNKLDKISMYLLMLGGLMLIFSILSPAIVLSFFEPKKPIDTSISIYQHTGPLGDTLGGVMNPFVAIAGVIITGLAFYAQFRANQAFLEANEDLKKQFQVQQFESQLYKLLDYHRLNVNDLEFDDRKEKHKGLKVLKSINSDIETLFSELSRFFNVYKIDEILQPDFKAALEQIKRERNNVDIIQLTRMNLAYYIVFIGLSAADTATLLRTLRRYYNESFLAEVLFYYRLKPSDPSLIQHWNNIKKVTMVKGFRIKYRTWCSTYNEELHNSEIDQDLNTAFMSVHQQIKYYGGQQFRLSHYFRNLFYIYKLINDAAFLGQEERKQYSKVVRSQLSTFELCLIFYNSISKMGWDWEYNNLHREDMQLISKYGIIKNIPGLKIRNYIDIRSYYPAIKYEFDADSIEEILRN